MAEYNHNDHDTIIRMAEQIKSIHHGIYDTEAGILSSFRKLNGRVKRLELWRAGLAGAIGVMVPILVFLALKVLA